jgi:FMN-dependent NADH-azoreductase
MKQVLVVKANNRPDGISTKMFDTFVEAAKQNENIELTTFDVFEANFPQYGQDLFNAFSKLQSGEPLNEVEAASIEAQQKAQAALTKADIIVFAFPLWNLSIPTPLQAFLDYNIQAGFSFKYNEHGQKDFLLGDKKVILLNARGGFYNTPEANAIEMAVNYMRAVIPNYLGFDIVDEVIIEGHAQDQANAAAIIEEGLGKVRAVAYSLNNKN